MGTKAPLLILLCCLLSGWSLSLTAQQLSNDPDKFVPEFVKLLEDIKTDAAKDAAGNMVEGAKDAAGDMAEGAGVEAKLTVNAAGDLVDENGKVHYKKGEFTIGEDGAFLDKDGKKIRVFLDKVKDALKGAGDKIKGAGGKLKDAAKGAGDKLKGAGDKAVDKVKGN